MEEEYAHNKANLTSYLALHLPRAQTVCCNSEDNQHLGNRNLLLRAALGSSQLFFHLLHMVVSGLFCRLAFQ